MSTTSIDNSLMKGLTSDTAEAEVRIDSSTHAQTVIEYEHHEIHAGSMYSITTIDSDLDDTAVLSVAFKTPNTTQYFHMLITARNTSSSIFNLLEGATVTAGTGTNALAYNHRRTSATPDTSTIISTKDAAAHYATVGATISADGTTLVAQHLGTGKNKGTGELRGADEYILAPNTVYVARITGLADNGDASLKVTYYQHTDK